MGLLGLTNGSTTKHSQSTQTNSEQTWEAVRPLINVKTKSNKQITCLNINNQIETNPKTI